MWWKIEDKFYDLSSFMDHHPGGKTALEMARGKDCTTLFYTYHLRLTPDSHHWKVLHSYECLPPTTTTDTLVKSESLRNDDLYWAMKAEVNRLVPNPRIPWSRLCLALILWVAQFLVVVKWLTTGNLAWGVMAGLLNVLCGLQVSHDGSHFAVSNVPSLNDLTVWSSLPFVYHPRWWYLQHVVQHHVYTNDRGDVDLIHLSPLGRLSPLMKWRWYYRLNAWVAAMFLPVMSTLAESIHYPFQIVWSFWQGRLHHSRLLAYSGESSSFLFGSRWKQFLFVLAWAISTAPFLWVAYHHSFLSAVSPSLGSGTWFFIVTQVSHLQPEAQAVELERVDDTTGQKVLPWSHRQLLHTIDYQVDSTWMNVLTGGLHIQSLHHLFPTVHHAHLPRIWHHLSAIAAEYDVHIVTRRSLFHALQTWWAWMRQLGRKPSS